MASIFDQVRKALKDLQGSATSVGNYFNPQVSGTKGFWGTETARNLANTQKAIQNDILPFKQERRQVGKQLTGAVNAFKPSVARFINNQAQKPAFPQLGSFSPTTGQTLNTAADFTYRPMFRAGGELGLNLRGQQQPFIPTTSLDKLLLGNEPLRNYKDPERFANQAANFVGKPEAAPGLIALGVSLDLLPFGSKGKAAATEAIQLAKKAKTLQEFNAALRGAKTEIRAYLGKMFEDSKNAINSTSDFYNIVKKTDSDPNLRKFAKNSFTNVREADNPLLYGKDWQSARTEGATPIKIEKALPWERKVFDASTTGSSSQKEKIFDDFIVRDPGTPVGKKIGMLDYLRTPDRVLAKIGLEKEASFLRRSYESYLEQLPKEIDTITAWAKRVPNSENRELYRYLDGQTNLKSLSDETQKVALEIKTYLKNWADKLDLPEDSRLTNYITHIFEKDFVQKEFPEDIAALIRDKVPSSTYDPFVSQRMGKLGYVEDTWRSLDAYVKRATRKVNMDPALKKISDVSESFEQSQFDYIKNYVDRINLRPTKIDLMLDNSIKQLVGYKLGVRPTTSITRTLRQMVYRGTLGFNVGTMLKNLTQGVNTFAKLGTKYTAVGYSKLFSNWKVATEELERVGVLKNDFIQDRTLNAAHKFWEKADRKGFFLLFELAEKINRGSAYFGSKAQALKMGKSELEAIEIAKKAVRDTQFTFGIDTPLVLQSDLAKTLLQFQSFNIKQAEMIVEMLKNKQFAQITRYTIGSLVVALTAGQAFGMEPSDFIPFYGVLTGKSKLGQTPITKAIMDIPSIVSPDARDKYGNELDFGDKANILLKDVTPFVPGGTQLKKTIEGINAYQQGASQTPTGRTRFEVEQTPINFLRAGVLGQYSLPKAREYFNNLGKSKSEIIYESLNKLSTPEEKSAKWQELVNDGTINSSNKSDIRQYFIDESIGLTDDEKEIRNLGVRDGSRARQIVAELNKLDNPKAKGLLWEKYKTAGILTEQVQAQVQHFLRNQ